MIKFTLDGAKGRKVIGIGLSQANIDKMKQGDPVFFKTEELGIPDLDVLIMYGETEDAIKLELRRHFRIGREVDNA